MCFWQRVEKGPQIAYQCDFHSGRRSMGVFGHSPSHWPDSGEQRESQAFLNLQSKKMQKNHWDLVNLTVYKIGINLTFKSE